MTTRAATPSDLAVVIAAHGDRGAGFSNAALLYHCAALHASNRFVSVTAGVLKGEPVLEDALSAAEASRAARIAIYPFFMADGFFVRTRLRERVAAARLIKPWEIFPPLGIDAELPGVVLQHAVSAAAHAGVVPAEATLLLVGHGSKLGPASANATRHAASQITATGVFAVVATAFLEEPPSVIEALREVKAPVVVSGFFSGDGMHAGDDVPAALAKSDRRAVYAGPVGNDSAISALILRRLIASR